MKYSVPCWFRVWVKLETEYKWVQTWVEGRNCCIKFVIPKPFLLILMLFEDYIHIYIYVFMCECVCMYVGINVFTYEYNPQTFLDMWSIFWFRILSTVLIKITWTALVIGDYPRCTCREVALLLLLFLFRKYWQHSYIMVMATAICLEEGKINKFAA